MNITEAIVLAGGKGTRMQSLLKGGQKCLAPVHGKPFLHYVLSHLRQEGISRVIFALGVDAEATRTYAEANWPLLEKRYSTETTPLGTGGAIKQAVARATEENLLIVNGDTLFRFNLRQAAELHFSAAADCTLLLKPLSNFERYGVVTLSNNNRVTGFEEKKKVDRGLVNAGAYLLKRSSFGRISLPNAFSFEKDFLETYFSQMKFMGCTQDEYFIDIGVPEDYEKAWTTLKTGTG